MRETAVMACIVATLAVVPVCGLLAILCIVVFDMTLLGFVTFGGALSAPLGVLAWWALVLVPAAVYAVILRHEGA